MSSKTSTSGIDTGIDTETGTGKLAPTAPYQPVRWLRELTHFQKTPWPWRRSMRAALCVPWAKNVSYAVLAVALTPLVLILLGLMAPGHAAPDFGEQRLVNTVIGAAIALVFGYYLWPHGHSRELAAGFSGVMAALADYLAAAWNGPEPRAQRVGRDCYMQLSDLRTVLGRGMAEPPPAGKEAASWIPLLAGAERICDRISVFLASRSTDAPLPPKVELDAAVQQLQQLSGHSQVKNPGPVSSPTLTGILEECAQIGRRLESTAHG